MPVVKQPFQFDLFRSFLVVAGLVFFGATTAPAQEKTREYAWYNPEKVVTSEPCGECHKSEYEVWKKTKHAIGFKSLHRTEISEMITKRMGFDLIKRESLCLKCHYLSGIKDGELRALSGVGCESCHGAARDWINIHNNYGPGGVKRNDETPEHKAQRIAESKAKGMFRPSELYAVIANCYQCHTVPHEQLVNVGGHPSGTRNFDFLKRLEEIRHNFLQAQFDPSRTENVERPPERKRVMYVAGQALDLEFGMRGAAVARENGAYIRAMQTRVRSAVIKLRTISNRVALPEIKDMLAIVGQVNVSPNNQAALLSAAAKISEATKKFIKTSDGRQLASLDGLIAGTDAPAPDAESGTGETPPVATAPSPESKTPETREVTKPPAPAVESSGETAKPPDFVKPQSNYAIKTRIRPRAQHNTIGPSCDCHKEINQWQETDRHFRSARPFFAKAQKNAQIARLYGLSLAEITKGNRLCMDCHGTVISGEEAEDVFDGVSCEGCHGPAADYKKPHSADKPPHGYVVGKDYGMLLLENLEVRAEACAQCHYITDPRLISSGHPTGANFDLARADNQIVHWKAPTPAPAELKAAYEKVVAKRGAIPTVEPRSLTTGIGTSEPAPPSNTTTQESDEARTAPPKPRPVLLSNLSPAKSAGRDIRLEPLNLKSDSSSVEEILLILKERLELLYKKVGEQP
ncbi:cytochrome c family protein [candidate division KSB1 bacterium]|nr:cytochrome c family protein [candidate division KSB1 bacterium]